MQPTCTAGPLPEQLPHRAVQLARPELLPPRKVPHLKPQRYHDLGAQEADHEERVHHWVGQAADQQHALSIEYQDPDQLQAQLAPHQKDQKHPEVRHTLVRLNGQHNCGLGPREADHGEDVQPRDGLTAGPQHQLSTEDQGPLRIALQHEVRRLPRLQPPPCMQIRNRQLRLAPLRPSPPQMLPLELPHGLQTPTELRGDPSVHRIAETVQLAVPGLLQPRKVPSQTPLPLLLLL